MDINKIYADALATKLKEFSVEKMSDLTDEQMAEVMNHQNSEASKALQAHAESYATAKTEELKKELAVKGEAEKAVFDAKIQEQAILIGKMSSKLNGLNSEGGKPSEAQAMKEAKEFFESLKTAVKSKKIAEFTIKADTLTTSVSNFTRGVEDPNVTRLAHRRLTIYDAIPSKIRIPENAGGTYRYLEQDSATSVRAAAQVSEGAAAPQSTIAWVKRSTDLKKTADYLPYSDEFKYDFQDLMPELAAFLRQNVDIEIDDQIVNGDGTGENYDGMLASIPAFTPVASSVADPNIFDLACKVSEDITDTEGSKYQPNLLIMNSSAIVSNNLLLKKDANNNYQPIMRMLNEKGFMVVENNSLADNVMLVGDNRYIHILEDGIITVKTGLFTGNDAIEGMANVLVSTRKNLLIKTEEQTGWREVTSISAALTTLAL